MRILEQCFAAVIAVGMAGVVSAQTNQTPASGDSRPPQPVQIVAPVPVPVTGSLEGSVSITGTPSVTDADNPGRHPFQAQLCPTIGITGCFAPKTLTVPSDVRAVIEFVTAGCSLAGPTVGHLRSVGLKTRVGGNDVSHLLVAVNSDDDQHANASQITRIYADPGTVIEGFAVAPGSGSGVCVISISGYTIAP